MKSPKIAPPQFASRLFAWYGRSTTIEDLHGDLDELFYHNLERMSPERAKMLYWKQVISLIFSYAVKRRKQRTSTHHLSHSPIHSAMLKNNFKITWRNLLKNKFSSFINVGGLSIGMTVAMLIGLWIWDELTFDRYHQHYDRIAQVLQQQTFNGTVNTDQAIPMPLDAAMRQNYGSDFSRMAMSSMTWPHPLTAGDKKISYPGNFIDADGPEIFSLRMLQGSRDVLADPSSILISEKVAKALFDDADPIGEFIKLDNKASFKVMGVYEDLPLNSSLHDVAFMAPWCYYRNSEEWLRHATAFWDDNSFLMYVQLADHVDMESASKRIKNVKLKNVSAEEAKFKSAMMLHPMNKWRLYDRFTNGVNSGGAIEYVWLFGIIGTFVLLLACINFMNLSTARSEKRAKETGIRKAIGSQRSQLISQFFCESLFIAAIALVISLILLALALPYFNIVANKQMQILWDNPMFWIVITGFTVVTGIIAGSYPALYLSSFQPINVLKGTFKAGRMASIPRQTLVVLQFTVSVVLIIGTIVVFEQIQFAKNRPLGYSRQRLVSIENSTDDLHRHFDALKAALLKSGAIDNVAESTSPTTWINNNRSDISWVGKDPSMTADFANLRITMEFGNTVGWQFLQGRDFSPAISTDSMAVVINETAAKYMGLKNPVGEIIRVGRRDLTVIGVIEDMVMMSPYEPVKQTVFYVSPNELGYIMIRINEKAEIHEALGKIEKACATFAPSIPFSYRFADDDYANKFAGEERIGKLSSSFAILAIFISCIGLFGMASFMAEQRTKEIGIRKIMGASVFILWRSMSQDFIILIIVSLCIAIPLAYYLMQSWLQNFNYHTEMSWWIFASTAIGAILITLITVSYQSIKAALASPVKSLRME